MKVRATFNQNQPHYEDIPIHKNSKLSTEDEIDQMVKNIMSKTFNN
jgi:hypothetical protein